MSLTDRERRRVLQLGGVALLSAVAGCLGDDDEEPLDDDNGEEPVDDDNDRASTDDDTMGDDNGGDEPISEEELAAERGNVPEYAAYLGLVDGEVTTMYIDIAGLDDLDRDYTGGGYGEGLEDVDDAMLSVPLGGMYVLMIGAGFALREASLDGLIYDDVIYEFESEIDDFILANGAMIFRGDIDADEVVTAMQNPPEGDMIASEFEEVEEFEGYRIFKPADAFEAFDPDDDSDDTTFALGDDKIIIGDTPANLGRALKPLIDEQTPATEDHEEFEWLLSWAGDAHVLFGGYSVDGPHEETTDDGDDTVEEDLSALDDATGFVNALTLTNDDATATLAATFEELDEDESRGAFEAEFGTEATVGPIFEFEDRSVVITSWYDDETLEGL